MGDRTRRLVPAVLASLALFLGLSAVGASAFAPSGDRMPAHTAVVPAVPAAGAHAARRGADASANPRVSWHRPAGGTSPAALLAAVVFGAAALVGRLRFRAGRTVPAGCGRLTRHSRAPPREVLPA